MFRVIILNQCTNHPKWGDVQIAQFDTWIKGNDFANVKILSYFPDPELDRYAFHEEGVRLNYGIDEDLEWVERDPRNERFIKALEYCVLNYKFDYILRTGSTCYIVIDKLLAYLDEIKSNRIYTGNFNTCYRIPGPNNKLILPDTRTQLYLAEEIPFNGGWNCLMSRDVVESLVNNKDEYLKYIEVEDVVTGKIIVNYAKSAKLSDQKNNKVINNRLLDESAIDGIMFHPYLYNIKVLAEEAELMYKLHDRIVSV